MNKYSSGAIGKETTRDELVQFTSLSMQVAVKIAALAGLSYAFAAMSQMEMAKGYVERALVVSKTYPQWKVHAIAASANLHLLQGRTAKAEKLYQEAQVEISQKFHNSKTLLLGLPLGIFYDNYAAVLRKMGRKREAAEVSELFASLSN